MGSSMPERVSWAVERLNVQPDDRLLEIGCGRGAAIAAVCEILGNGRVTAIDRSAKATAAARDRNAQHIRDGKAVIHTVSLDEVNLPDDTFHKIFAINVSLFWTGTATHELKLIRQMLKPGGSLHLFYEPPSKSGADATATKVASHLTAAGFASHTTTAVAQHNAATLLHIVGTELDGPARVG